MKGSSKSLIFWTFKNSLHYLPDQEHHSEYNTMHVETEKGGRKSAQASLITVSINAREVQSEIMLSNTIAGRYERKECYAVEANKTGGCCLREQ